MKKHTLKTNAIKVDSSKVSAVKNTTDLVFGGKEFVGMRERESERKREKVEGSERKRVWRRFFGRLNFKSTLGSGWNKWKPGNGF